MATRLLILGLFLVLLGVQFRLVDTYVLNEKASRVVAEKLRPQRQSADAVFPSLATASYDSYLTGISALAAELPRESIKPPRWLAWSLISAGAVMVLGYPCFRK